MIDMDFKRVPSSKLLAFFNLHQVHQICGQWVMRASEEAATANIIPTNQYLCLPKWTISSLLLTNRRFDHWYCPTAKWAALRRRERWGRRVAASPLRPRALPRAVVGMTAARPPAINQRGLAPKSSRILSWCVNNSVPMPIPSTVELFRANSVS